MAVADTAERLLRLLSLLQSRPAVTGPELADALGVAGRTVRRDVDRLRRLGYPVDATFGAVGGYALRPGADLPPLLLDDDEAVAVAVGLRLAAAGMVSGLEAAAVAAMAKVEALLPARLRGRVDALGVATVPLLGARPTVTPALLGVLAQACRDCLELRFRYTRGDGAAAERRVEPYRLVPTAHRWYLVARDLDRAAAGGPGDDGWRTFRVDRIEGCETPGHRFVRRDPPDAAALVAASTAVSPYPVRAKVRLHAPLVDVAELIPPTVGLLEAAGGATVLTTGAYDLDAIALHLGLLPFPFTVIEPSELAERVAVLAARLASHRRLPCPPD